MEMDRALQFGAQGQGLTGDQLGFTAVIVTHLGSLYFINHAISEKIAICVTALE